MKKVAVILGGLALAGCGAGSVVPVVTSIFDAINSYTLAHCGYSFAFATIDAITKALGGQPVADVIGGLLCTEARTLQAQQAPKAAGVTATGQSIVDLGTVVINGKPVRIQVLR
jgi:hypothetical protein